MSPLLLRRYRAERLLRQEFEGQRERVLKVVRARLRARGIAFDAADLEACYSQAWAGLYTAVLGGEEIDNRTGWLVLVTFRRAIDEHRARLREDREQIDDAVLETYQASDGDLAQELDDRVKLRQLFEGLRGGLNERECEAASLCYLQGLSRSQAAVQMGLSETRMRKLMEGSGKGLGVAAKVGELLETIRDGGWCEQQSSLMRGLAFGILDPGGERYRLARLHRQECPACRAYVLSLRGLASVLPPVGLPMGLGVGALAGAGAGAGAGVGGGAGAGGGAAAVGAGAGGGAAGGGWLLVGGQVGAKLAVGCAMALSLGAGCVVLTEGHGYHTHRAPSHKQVVGDRGRTLTSKRSPRVAVRVSSTKQHARVARATVTTPAHRAQQEFGPEHALAHVAPRPSSSPRNAATREFGVG